MIFIYKIYAKVFFSLSMNILETILSFIHEKRLDQTGKMDLLNNKYNGLILIKKITRQSVCCFIIIIIIIISFKDTV